MQKGISQEKFMTQIQSAAMGTTSMKHQFAGIAGRSMMGARSMMMGASQEMYLKYLIKKRRTLHREMYSDF